MFYLYVNLLHRDGQFQLNPDEAVVRLQEHFPEAIILPGDQLARSAQRAERQLDSANAAHRAVVAKLWWDAQHSGPAYAFFLPAGVEPRVDGVIKRYQADFHSDTPVSEPLRARIVAFLRSLIPAGAGIDVSVEADEE